LGMPVAAQQYAEIVEPGYDTLKFDTVDQEDREWNLVLTDKIEKSVLQILWPLRSHVPVSYFFFGAFPSAYCSLKTARAVRLPFAPWTAYAITLTCAIRSRIRPLPAPDHIRPIG